MTMSRTVYSPGTRNVCFASWPSPVVPSPKSHTNERIESFGSDDALASFNKKSALRVLSAPQPNGAGGLDLRPIEGGVLAQTRDVERDDPSSWECPTARQPGDDELRALELAWTVCRSVKSNAIVVANEHQTVGIGAGQMSRVDSCRLALSKAQLEVDGCAAASDGFFPFRDGLDVLAEAGIRAVVQPGGS